MKELIVYGEEGLSYIKQFGGLEFMYYSMVDVERYIISSLIDWFDVLKSHKLYENVPEISSEFPKDKSFAHQIAVKCKSTSGFIAESLSNNMRDFFWEKTETETIQFLVRGGMYPAACTLSLISTERAKVTRLADVIYQGLLSDIREILKKQGIHITPNSIKSGGEPKRIEITASRGYWQLDIQLTDLQIPWQQILTIEGEIIKDFSFNTHIE